MTEFKAPVGKSKENQGEIYFSWYLDELLQQGYLKEYQREPETFLVLPRYKFKKEKHFKKKENEYVSFNLFPDLSYTYDYRLIWNEKALNIFTELMHKDGHFRFGVPDFVSHNIEINGKTEIVSYVDVKPHRAAARFGGGKISTFYTFPLIQKFLAHFHHIYINKIVPTNTGKHGIATCLFAKTFTPNRYLFTDAGKQMRKIPFMRVSLSNYVKRKKTIIESALKIIEDKNSKGQQTSLL
jgi:hypothetical protein